MKNKKFNKKKDDHEFLFPPPLPPKIGDFSL